MSVVVMVVREHRKDALGCEERGLAVRELLAGLGQREAQIADAFDLVFVGHWFPQIIMERR